MRFIISWLLAACLLAAGQARANVKAVFAHFMVGNTGLYTVADWEDDISKASAAHIDGFVLNMAADEATNGASLANAFTAANNLGSGFKLLFSFDYAGNGLWDKQDVIALINQYASNPAYYRRGSQPLVSTFEGPAASGDWPSIKAATGCFFMPSWSSLGAAPAWAKGTADGLFSWAAWPEGPKSMSTFTDHSYLDTLGGAPYMMGVSPWFYTNMPGYRKNWLWRGDSLWFDRWVHVMHLQPEYVQIISWNDYGESHYIGPLRDKAYVAFDGAHGRAPFNYVLDKPHDGWRTFLPFLIDMAKSNTTVVSQENVVAWYRETPGSACGTGGTTGNTASQLQQTYPPAVLAQDRVFYAALLGSPASISVSIGGQSVAGTWDITASSGAGLYRGSVPVDGRTGPVVVSITRSSSSIVQASGNPITTACTGGMTNWNPIVISGSPRSIAPAMPLSLSGSVCTSGFGDPKYLDLCSFACRYGYCPPVCTCTSLGAAVEKPAAMNINACPKAGMDSTYLGLCSFGCNYGYCPPSLCQVHPAGHVCTAPNPTAPPIPVCVSGMADGAYADLCSFSCHYGFCPPEICTCTQAGSATAAPAPPPATDMVGGPKAGAVDYGLCQWACRHGNCPSHLCTCSGSGCSGGGETPGGLLFQYPSKLAVTQSLAGHLMGSMPLDWGGPVYDGSLGNGPVCRLASSCTRQDRGYESRCGPHEVKLGWDKAGCEGGGSYYGRSICCAAWEAVTECTWRGEGSDGGCNGQCQAGEVQLWHSVWGNKPDRCKRGTKAFCCRAIEYSLVTRGCSWTTCGRDCGMRKTRVLSKRTGRKTWGEGAEGCLPVQHYCCPEDHLLSNCVWRGTAPDCGDATCHDDEIAVDLGPFGYSLERCQSGRKKIACCKANAPPQRPVAPSPGGVCKPDFDWCAANPLECALEDTDFEFVEDGGAAGLYARALAERGSAREIGKFIAGTTKMLSRPYPSRGEFISKTLAKSGSVAWWAGQNVCDKYSTAMAKFTSIRAAAVPQALDVEHPIDLQVLPQFAHSCISGILPGGAISKFATIPAEWFLNVFMQDGILPAGLPRVSPTSPDIRNAMDRVFEAFGSHTNMFTLLLADKQMNQVKGKLVQLYRPMAPKAFDKALKLGAAGNREGAMDAISYLKATLSVFNYLQQPEVSATFHAVVDNIRAQLAIVASNTQGAADLAERWDEFFPALLRAVVGHARSWSAERLLEAANHYGQFHGPVGGNTVFAEQMRLILFLSTRLGEFSIKYKDEVIN